MGQPTQHHDRIGFFEGISIMNFHSMSIISTGAGEGLHGFSFTQTFNPAFSINPREANAAAIAQNLATLIMVLMQRRT